MKTPLYNVLVKYSKSSPLRFHMPGHKGKPLYSGVWGDITALDVTELPQTGDLYREDSGAIREAEALLAAAYGANEAIMLTGGSTQGIFAMLAANTSPGDKVLTDRLCHYSAVNAMALLDLQPVYIYRNITGSIALPILPADVEAALTPDIKAVFITSPTYNGICSDLGAIYNVCERHGAKLLLDAAHGAHLPFVPGFQGCFSYHHAVMSAHKTLPALGQAAFLLSKVGGASALRRAAMLTGTSSPSYPIMASIDLARAFLDEHGIEQGKLLYDSVITHGNDYTLLSCDPLRVNVLSGHRPFEDEGIIPELSNSVMAIFIISLSDGADSVRRLFEVITSCGGKPLRCEPSQMPRAKVVMSVRSAVMNKRKTVMSAVNAVGLTAAEPIAPFPPGVPLLMPGEVLEHRHLEYLDPCGTYYFIP